MLIFISVMGKIFCLQKHMKNTTITTEKFGKHIMIPHLETEDAYYIISSDSDLEKYIYDVTSKMTELVMENTGLSFNVAGMLLSAVGDEICQVIDPKRTLHLKILKKYIIIKNE